MFGKRPDLRRRGNWRRTHGARALAVTAMCRTAGIVARPRPPDGRALPATDSPAIVVIKPLAIGDVLRTTPFLDALRRALPRARITYAVGDYAARAVANNPHIDDVMPMGLLGTPRRFDVYSYLHFARRLRARRFDVAFVPDRSPLMALLPYLARIPRRVGLHSRGRGFAHTTRVPIARDDHEVDAYLRLAQAAGIPTDGARPHFYPTPHDTEAATRLLQEFGLGAARPRVIMAPGGGVNPGAVDVSKRWPVDRFARVADELIGRHSASIVLVGLPSDVTSVTAVRRALRSGVVDLAGQTSFGQLAALIQAADLFVGNDSASAQLAASVDTPSVTVFTTTEPWIYGPKGAHAHWAYRGSPGRGLAGPPGVDRVIELAKLALSDRSGPADPTLGHHQARPNPDSTEV